MVVLPVMLNEFPVYVKLADAVAAFVVPSDSMILP
jgi:hypothetical protein